MMEEQVMLKELLITLLLMSGCSCLFAGDVSGTILQLDGNNIPSLTDFVVTAQVGGVIVARGGLTTAQPPFKYALNIPEGSLNPRDVRVRLVFTAAGRQTVVIDGIAGNAQHDLSIVMPVSTACCPCWQGCPRWRLISNRSKR